MDDKNNNNGFDIPESWREASDERSAGKNVSVQTDVPIRNDSDNSKEKLIYIIAILGVICALGVMLCIHMNNQKKFSGNDSVSEVPGITNEIVFDNDASAVNITGSNHETNNKNVMVAEESKRNDDKMSAKEEISDKEKFVDFIIENESLWLDELRSGSMNSTADECWFQDCDMDGFPEFICGDDVLGNKGFSHYYILKYNNGSEIYDLNTGQTSSKGGSSDFNLVLYRKGDQFVYIHEYFGTTAWEEHGLIEYSGNWITDKNSATILHCKASDKESFDFDGLSRDEFINRFYDYYSGMTPYIVSVRAVPCSRDSAYDNYSESEKRQKLMESFDAWGYSESTHNAVTAPLSDFIVRLNGIKESENADSNKSVNIRDNSNIYGDLDKAYITDDMIYYVDAYIGYVDISEGVLNFRSTPSTSSDVLLKLTKDEKIFIQYEGRDWVYGYLRLNGDLYYGYASKQYIRREYRDYQVPYEEQVK